MWYNIYIFRILNSANPFSHVPAEENPFIPGTVHITASGASTVTKLEGLAQAGSKK